MAALIVSAAGQVGPLISGRVQIRSVTLYMMVARLDGTPVSGLLGEQFAVTLFSAPGLSVDVPTTSLNRRSAIRRRSFG